MLHPKVLFEPFGEFFHELAVVGEPARFVDAVDVGVQPGSFGEVRLGDGDHSFPSFPAISLRYLP